MFLPTINKKVNTLHNKLIQYILRMGPQFIKSHYFVLFHELYMLFKVVL